MSRVHRNDAIDGLLHRFAGLGSPLEDDEGLLEALGPLLERAAGALREAEPSLDPLMRAHLERRLTVYGDLVSGLTRLAHDVEAPIAVVPGASPG
jgi:hypothetical protein